MIGVLEIGQPLHQVLLHFGAFGSVLHGKSNIPPELILEPILRRSSGFWGLEVRAAHAKVTMAEEYCQPLQDEPVGLGIDAFPRSSDGLHLTTFKMPEFSRHQSRNMELIIWLVMISICIWYPFYYPIETQDLFLYLTESYV